MKRLLFFLLTFFFINSVNGLELKEFQVLNGNLSLPFESLNNVYTIFLNEGEEKMEFEYKTDLEEGKYDIEVNNNIFIENKSNPAELKLINKETNETVSYTFYLEKERSTNVFNEYNEPPANTAVIENLIYYIGGMCLLSIIILFKIIVLGFKK